MKRSTECAKCGGRMSEGFIVDEAHGRYGVQTWQAGGPEKSFWVGTKMRKSDQVKVQTWRCDKCGFLESYATGH